MLFRALAIGPMSVASPLSAVITVVFPVCAGLLFGERLPAIAWVGIALGIGAVLMVSQVHEDAPHPITPQVIWLAAGAGTFHLNLLYRVAEVTRRQWALAIGCGSSCHDSPACRGSDGQGCPAPPTP